jgi:hypothetical protein
MPHGLSVARASLVDRRLSLPGKLLANAASPGGEKNNPRRFFQRYPTHLLKQAEESSPETAEEMRSDRAERMKTIDQDDPAFDIP